MAILPYPFRVPGECIPSPATARYWRARVLPAVLGLIPASCRGGASQLPLEGRDVSPAESPLPPALEGRQDALARELIHGVGAEVEDLRDLLAVQQRVFLVQHGPDGAIPRSVCS